MHEERRDETCPRVQVFVFDLLALDGADLRAAVRGTCTRRGRSSSARSKCRTSSRRWKAARSPVRCSFPPILNGARCARSALKSSTEWSGALPESLTRIRSLVKG